MRIEDRASLQAHADRERRTLGNLSLPKKKFDFRKLVRFCEEINSAYGSQCYFATAMLMRGLLDHLPPVLGCKTFVEVSNRYASGGKSFKDTMQHLELTSRKVADAHLHMPIRKSETRIRGNAELQHRLAVGQTTIGER
jgi:hypothetical protein